MSAERIPKYVRVEKLRKCPFCAVCFTEKDLELHHFDPKGPATVDNLVVLCSKHHMAIHDVQAKSRHKDLVVEAIHDARQRGVVFGRPKADYEKVMRLIAEHSTQFNNIYDADYDPKTEREIMDMAGVKEVCYSKCKRMLVEAVNAHEWPFEWKKPSICKNRPLYDAVVKRLRGDGVVEDE